MTAAGSRLSRWVAGVVLSGCFGVSIGLLSGDGGKGFFVALVLAFVITLVVGLTAAGGRRSPKEIYSYAALVLVGPWLLLKLGYEGGSGSGPPGWRLLQARYGATGPKPGDLQRVREVVVQRHVDAFMVRRHRLKSVSTSLDDSGAYFAPSFPMSWVYDPIRVPPRSVRACRRDAVTNLGYTTLSLREEPLEIEVVDDDERILRWCERYEIPDG